MNISKKLSQKSLNRQKKLKGGNPLVVLNENAIEKDDGIVTVNLPIRSGLESMAAVWGPFLQETPAGGSLMLKDSILDVAGSNCGALPTTANYGKVLGKLRFIGLVVFI